MRKQLMLGRLGHYTAFAIASLAVLCLLGVTTIGEAAHAVAFSAVGWFWRSLEEIYL